MKRNVISIVTLIAILTAVLCGAAFAENENYSYNKGITRERHHGCRFPQISGNATGLSEVET